MTGRLPEEILREILKYCVFIAPIHTFLLDAAFQSYNHHTEFDGPLHMPRSDVLLVSRLWLRVGSPLFYHTIILHNSRQVQQLVKVLRANPGLGDAVHNLRLQGGYGRDLLTIVNLTPNVYALAVYMDVPSTESIVGITRALPLLNPQRCYLHGAGLPRLANKQSVALRDALIEWLANCQSLEQVFIPKYYHPVVLDNVLDALEKAPALKSISMGEADLERRLMTHSIFNTGRLETIVCRNERDTFAEYMTGTGVPEDVQKRVLCVDTQESSKFKAMAARLRSSLEDS